MSQLIVLCLILIIFSAIFSQFSNDIELIYIPDKLIFDRLR